MVSTYMQMLIAKEKLLVIFKSQINDKDVKFYISIGYLNKRVMHINSNDVPSQNQLAIGGVAHKLYIHTQALEFYQCGKNPTFIFQQKMSYRWVSYLFFFLAKRDIK